MNDVDRILSVYADRKSIKGVKKIVGVSDHRIRKVLTANGITINVTHKKILEMHDKGMTVSDIASTLRISESVVQSYLPPVRPIYRINPSVNALRIKKCREKKKNKEDTYGR